MHYITVSLREIADSWLYYTASTPNEGGKYEGIIVDIDPPNVVVTSLVSPSAGEAAVL